jgi:mRNA interferase MazF
MSVYNQGEIVWADLDPVRGSEQAGKRPSVIISGDVMNDVMTIRIACLLTKQLRRGRPARVFIARNSTNGLTEDSDVLVTQVRTISVKRCGKVIGRVTEVQLEEIQKELDGLLGK